MLYSEKVMDHFEHPRNVGEIENADGVGEVGNPTCGDIMRIYLKIDNDIITDVKFKTFGCGSAIASSSSWFMAIPVGLVGLTTTKPLTRSHLAQWLLSLSRARASKKLLNYLTRQWLKLLMVYHQERYTVQY